MAASNDIITRARKLRYDFVESKAADLNDDDAINYKDAFPRWTYEKSYQIGDRVRYGEKLYKCVQAHTAQSDWTPPATPALWTEVAAPGEIPEWKQPTGAQDAYMAGDKVKHNDKTWISTADNNVWEPGVYGWDKL